MLIKVLLPNNERPRYRLIVKKRLDGRLIVRAPKIGVSIRHLKKMLPEDFGPESLLPRDAKII